MIRAGGVSDPGPIRGNNEDAFVCLVDFNLFLVADGMGGHAAGEIASRLACEAIEGFIRRTAETQEFTWPFGVDPQLSWGGNRLRTALLLANRRVFSVSEANAEYEGMGTTVVAALVDDRELTVAHLGDSRIYQLTGGELKRLTLDDSWSERVLEQEQRLDQDQIAVHRKRHALTNVVGAWADVVPHVAHHAMMPGDRFLLCTDGICGVLDDVELRRLLADGASEPRAIAAAIVDAALASGSRDNATAVVVCVE